MASITMQCTKYNKYHYHITQQFVPIIISITLGTYVQYSRLVDNVPSLAFLGDDAVPKPT